ncbi:DUF1415 domain-containing protein [Paraglaciecola marina]|uniref:DUF1415 domain-containing protein n=1 Tax=Paraglaciecola marina TaxID=2500157 RepID=UPI00105D7EA0|nr:DUF1415 domain-containing protein [Paraglaciecola marina]
MTINTQQTQIITSVKKWINDVIIDLNFCPFAKKEVIRDTIRYCVSDAVYENKALDTVINELSTLDNLSEIQTTLIIFSSGFSDFDRYLDLVDGANEFIERGGYRGLYQIATFHPDYCFDGENSNDAANYTNRSPYPILHLLREASLEQVLKNYPNPENIPDNNITKARELGVNYFKKQLQIK